MACSPMSRAVPPLQTSSRGTTAGSLRKWSNNFFNEDLARLGQHDKVQMLQANLGPANPRTMRRHNCMQQALESEGVYTIPEKHAM